MKTKITEMLGIKYPIICGGMMRINYPPFCAAISNAGALGNLTSTMYAGKKELQAAIREVRKLTDRPFNVTVTILPSMTVNFDQYRGYFEACAEEKVPCMEISGLPLNRFDDGKYIKILKDAGVILFHKVGSVRHGKNAQRSGYDGVYAAGVEEGGHPNNENVATTVLTPRLVEELTIPVVTTGGMANGRSLAAALCLGAEGIMMASRFISTVECPVHDNVKRELIGRQEYETALYGNSLGLQGRALINDSLVEIQKIEARCGSLEECMPHMTGQHGDRIWKEGKTDKGLINVGQSIGLIHDIPTCRELIEGIVKEAGEVLGQVKAKF